MNLNEECRFCEAPIINKCLFGDYNHHAAYICPVCGVYLLSTNFDVFDLFELDDKENNLNKSHIASYLFYNKVSVNEYKTKRRIYIGEDESQLNFIKSFFKKQGSDYKGTYDLLTKETANEFCSKKITEKEELLLNIIYQKSDKITYQAKFEIEEIFSAAFVIRQIQWEYNYNQYKRILDDLENQKYIKVIDDGKSHDPVIIEITMDGIKYVQGDKKMDEKKNVTSYTDNSITISNSTVNKSVVGNNNTTNFDFNDLSKAIEEIEAIYKLEKNFSDETKNEIHKELEELKQAINSKNKSTIIKCINAIVTFAKGVATTVITNGIVSRLESFLPQIPGLFLN